MLASKSRFLSLALRTIRATNKNALETKAKIRFAMWAIQDKSVKIHTCATNYVQTSQIYKVNIARYLRFSKIPAELADLPNLPNISAGHN